MSQLHCHNYYWFLIIMKLFETALEVVQRLICAMISFTTTLNDWTNLEFEINYQASQLPAG